jgi:Zn finger protein HypA/HybF involved in hydrogenase expression
MSRSKDLILEAMEGSSQFEEKDIEYNILQCGNCKAVLEVKCYIFRGFSDHEDVNCPKCGKFIANIRADEGFEITKVSQPRKKSATKKTRRKKS